MLYGFLGMEPTGQGMRLRPRLPKGWPELRISQVHLHDQVLEITARADGTITVTADKPPDLPLVIDLPPSRWSADAPEAEVKGSRVTLRTMTGPVTLRPVR